MIKYNKLNIFLICITGYRLQVAGYRLQVAGYRLQVTGYRLQVTGRNKVANFAHLSFVASKVPTGTHVERRDCWVEKAIGGLGDEANQIDLILIKTNYVLLTHIDDSLYSLHSLLTVGFMLQVSGSFTGCWLAGFWLLVSWVEKAIGGLGVGATRRQGDEVIWRQGDLVNVCTFCSQIK